MYTIETESSEKKPSDQPADFNTFRDILEPVHTESANMTQEELDEFTDDLIRKVRAERRAKQAAESESAK